MRLLLSIDAKPRLKWTKELHRIFVGAVDKLGGADKATPKTLMKAMDVEGLTMYHLKSHLQKYRMSRTNLSRTHRKPKGDSLSRETSQMQTEADKKLHEHVEIQKYLQLRIESQGRYLQSVLRKACEALSEYNLCSEELKLARIQLESVFESTLSGDKRDNVLGCNNISTEISSLASCLSNESIAMKKKPHGDDKDGENDRDFIDLNVLDYMHQ